MKLVDMVRSNLFVEVQSFGKDFIGDISEVQEGRNNNAKVDLFTVEEICSRKNTFLGCRA